MLVLFIWRLYYASLTESNIKNIKIKLCFVCVEESVNVFVVVVEIFSYCFSRFVSKANTPYVLNVVLFCLIRLSAVFNNIKSGCKESK